MIQEGLNYVIEHDLSHSEINVLLCLLEGKLTNKEIADKLDKAKCTIHPLLLKLRLKKIVKIMSKDKKGTILYGIIIP